MRKIEPLNALGIASDTGITSVEVAFLRTDGLDIYDRGKAISRPYSKELRSEIKSVLGQKGQCNYIHLKEVERKLTAFHIETVKEFLGENSFDKIDVIGYPGHTVLHLPSVQKSYQIGDAERLATVFQTGVVTRFIQSDLFAGGQGAPLYPTFYEALTRMEKKPLVMLDIGGLSSITFIGANGELLAFVAGPGNFLLDAWMQKKEGQEMDFNGLMGAKGTPNQRVVKKLLKEKYFLKEPPKAIDRQEFDVLMEDIEGLNVADGAATLTEFSMELIVQSIKNFIPVYPEKIIVCGGGSFNPTFIRLLRKKLTAEVVLSKELGWESKSLEAEGNAFLAVRHLYELPISLPSTTKVLEPISGGMWVQPQKEE